MEEWKTYQISDIATVITGKTPSTKNPDYYGGSIHFVTPADINKGSKHIIDTDRTISEMGMFSVKGSIIPKGSTCVSCIGNIGYVGMTTMNCISNQQINTVIPKSNCDKDFLYYLMRSLWPVFKNYEGQSTTLSILNKSQFSKIPVKLPSLQIQRKIASVLSSIDNKIELNNQINHNLEEQAHALYKSWFVDFEPFKTSDFTPSELGMIPMGWKVGTLSDLLTIKYGKDHKKLLDGTVPVYGSGGLMRMVNSTLYSGESVLIPRKGTLNNVMYVNEAFWTVDTMFYSIGKIPGCIKYCHQILRKMDLASMNAGSAVPSMTTDILNAIQIEIPPLDVLSQYDAIVSSLYNSISSNEVNTGVLTKTRDSLLPKLMSGELSVNSIDC